MSKPTDYSIKGFKSFTGMEGLGFNASLYFKDQRIAFVIDSAHGGPLDWDFLQKPTETMTIKNHYKREASDPATIELKVTPFQKEFLEMVEALPLDPPSEYFPEGMRVDIDTFMIQLVQKHENTVAMKRKLNRQVHFKEGSDIYHYNNMKPTPENIEFVQKKHPKAIVLNALPVEEAFDHWYA